MMAGVTPASPTGSITSDASGSWGCGAFTSAGEWFHLALPESWNGIHITTKELLPIVIGTALWGEQWRGKTVRCWCDNAAVVAIIRSGSSRDERVMHLMRSLFFILAHFNMQITAQHVPGVENGAADALSRNDAASFLAQVPSAHREPSTIPAQLLQMLVHSQHDWMSQNWTSSWGGFFAKGLAESTQRTYRSGQNKYLRFCEAGGFQAVPASEAVLCRFVAHTAEVGLRHRTIKVYLSAVRFLHIAEGEKDLFEPGLLRLQYTLQGISRAEAEKGREKRERLPISPVILRKMKAVWESEPPPGAAMLWAACCLGFFGFLRSGEMTVQADGSYDPGCHLSRADVAVDNPADPGIIRVHIKQSKTDPFRKGVHLFIGRTQSDICPVRAILNYLVVRGKM